MKEITLAVDGMMCSGCENRVRNVISKIDGVTDIKVSYEKGIVVLVLEDNINIQSVKDKIINLGYLVK